MLELHMVLNKTFKHSKRSSYTFGRVLRNPRIINMLGLVYTRVENMARLQRV